MLERLVLHALGHLVLEKHMRWVQHLGQISLLELTAGNGRQHHAPTVGHHQCASVFRARRLFQFRVFLQGGDHFQHMGARLGHGVAH
ncbi:hypothetical protein D3C85_1744700 [compost metagenome]